MSEKELVLPKKGELTAAVLFSTELPPFPSLSPGVSRSELESETSACAGSSLSAVFAALFPFEKESVLLLLEESVKLISSEPISSDLAAGSLTFSLPALLYSERSLLARKEG
jgi:hypothetical protein